VLRCRAGILGSFAAFQREAVRAVKSGTISGQFPQTALTRFGSPDIYPTAHLAIRAFVTVVSSQAVRNGTLVVERASRCSVLSRFARKTGSMRRRGSVRHRL